MDRFEPSKRAQAKRRFDHIVNHFEPGSDRDNKGRIPYNLPRLVRLTYEYARSEESKDGFLQFFFDHMELLPDREDNDDINLGDPKIEEDLRTALLGLANFLIDNLFLPLKVSGGRTPNPTPDSGSYSAAERMRAGEEFGGTPNRFTGLRRLCLIRDHYRCAISREYETDEAEKRTTSYGDDAEDDDGHRILHGSNSFNILKVAHIIPHSLTRIESGSSQLGQKQTVLDLLDLLDRGIGYIVKGGGIDRPENAITLNPTSHRYFSAFRIFFTEVPDQPSHTYCINSFSLARFLGLPVTRTLFEDLTIDPPSRRLLALHSAIAHILHLSGVGRYIDKLIIDMDEMGILDDDGSTDFGRLVTLALYGWHRGTSRGNVCA